VERVSRIIILTFLGTQRRVQKKKPNKNVKVDANTKIVAAMGKSKCILHFLYWHFIGVQDIPDIEETNMFRNDGEVLHFRKPNSK